MSGNFYKVWDSYEPPIVFSMSLILAVFCVFQAVRVTYAPKGTKNKLTMLPYYLMLASELICATYIIALVCDTLYTPDSKAEIPYWSILLSLKQITENTAIAIQIFEWLCIYHMINFQKKY